MSVACAIFVTAWFAVVPVSALLPPPPPLATSSFGARQSRPPLHLLCSIRRTLHDVRSAGHLSLRSSLDEIFEMEAAAKNETSNDKKQQQHQQQHGILTGAATSAAASCDSIGDASKSSSPQQDLQRFLSSPDLLDPASILQATTGITDENNAVTCADSSSAAGEAVVTHDMATTATPFTTAAGSKDEDLELTRLAIMKHFEMRIGDEDEEEGEDEEDAENILRTGLSVDNELEQLDLRETTTSTSTKNGLIEITPSIPKILRYTIPAIGIWLCSPVLSMIDTASVGLLSGTAQQAALNPAVSVTDYGALVVAFMYTATTNLIAAAMQEDKDDGAAESRPKTTTTLITALKLALLVGSLFGVILGASGEFLIKLLIGNDDLDPAVIGAALRYVRIRALGVPAMVVTGTAQSACLGMQDVRSPLYVLLAAAIVNFFGDVLLVPRAGSVLFGGAAGAAWATVASQYAALIFFGRWLTKGAIKSDHDSVVDVTQGIMELMGNSEAGRSRRKRFRKFLISSNLSRRIRLVSRTTSESPENSPLDTIEELGREHKQRRRPATKGFLSNGKLTLRNYLSFSNINFNRSKAKEFLPFVVPVTTTSAGRISGYIAMSHVASSTLGTFEMAAHQIIFSIFCCLTPFVDAIGQVAQSFVPAVFEAKEEGNERAIALRKTTGNFRKVGVGIGAILLGLVACIPLIGRYFTTDPIVLARVNAAIPGLGFFLLVHGLMCAGEGTLLGQKDLNFLRNMYTIFFFTVPAYMLRLKHRALAGVQTVGIGTMWAAFSTYNLIRTSVWHLRLAQLQRRTERRIHFFEEGEKGKHMAPRILDWHVDKKVYDSD